MLRHVEIRPSLIDGILKKQQFKKKTQDETTLPSKSNANNTVESQLETDFSNFSNNDNANFDFLNGQFDYFLTNHYSSIIVYFLQALFFSSFILTAYNPIYSLLALIVVFACVLISFLTIGIEFLSLIYLIIYVGAIAILFLFVIMMFNIKRMPRLVLSYEFIFNIMLTVILNISLLIILLENVTFLEILLKVFLSF
jgi:NADH:ubiquinone oxidoreductase subunit 6 (subunit J)